MPNCVANASMCVLPNLTQHKTNPICLHLPTMWCTCLTMSAPMPNCVCAYPLPCMHLHLTVWCIQACVANGRPNPMSAPTYMWRMHQSWKKCLVSLVTWEEAEKLAAKHVNFDALEPLKNAWFSTFLALKLVFSTVTSKIKVIFSRYIEQISFCRNFFHIW